MGDILNNLTHAELMEIRERALAKRVDRNCLWCEKKIPMRKDQKFCCAVCRAAFAQNVAQAEHDKLIREKAAWLVEREGLIREVAALQARLPGD
jgi:hypothetical protein